MKNKELFDRANQDKDLKLQEKLRDDFQNWCKKNGRTAGNPQTIMDWWGEDVDWKNQK